MHKTLRVRLLFIIATSACVTLITWLNVGVFLSNSSRLHSKQIDETQNGLNSLLDRDLVRDHNGSLDRPDEVRLKRLPKAIIIGARKSGTRALLRFLELNPAVRPAHNEVHFFDNRQNFIKGFDWYKNQMPDTKPSEIAIEKSPAYFVTSQVPERVRSMNSSTKLILIMRDPVTRLISDFSQLVANRFEHEDDDGLDSKVANNNKTLENKIWRDAEKEFESYALRSDGGIDNQRRAVKTGMYSNYLERWLAHFPRDQFHFVDGEHLIENPYDVMRKLEEFLGLEARIRPNQFVFDPKKGFYCILANATSSLHRSSDDYKNSPMDGSSELQSHEQQHICLSKSKGRRHVNVNRQLLDRLYEFYAPYNEYLFTLTGINFNRKK